MPLPQTSLRDVLDPIDDLLLTFSPVVNAQKNMKIKKVKNNTICSTHSRTNLIIKKSSVIILICDRSVLEQAM
jgi:hypothetical protein